MPYEVHLRGGINVGLFTDMREHRAGLARFVRGKRVLNTFAYTGALSVAAARAGAPRGHQRRSRRRAARLGARQLRALRARPRRATAGRSRTSSLPRGGARARRDLRRRHPRSRRRCRARARSLWAQKRDYPDLIAAACAVAAGGRPPLDLVEHAPRARACSSTSTRARPRQARRAGPRARRPAARLPDAPVLAGRALPRGRLAVGGAVGSGRGAKHPLTVPETDGPPGNHPRL